MTNPARLPRHAAATLAVVALVVGLVISTLAAGSAQGAGTPVCSTRSAAVCISDFTVGATTVDVTRAPSPAVPISVRMVSPNGFADYTDVWVISTSNPPAGGMQIRPSEVYARLTLTSGTRYNGVWSGSLRLPPGWARTWELSLPAVDAAENVIDASVSALRAAGYRTTVSTRVTAAPPAATGFAVRTEWYQSGPLTGGWTARASWSAQPSGQVARAGWEWVTSGSCGARSFILPYENSSTWNRFFRMSSGTCTVTGRPVNDAGKAPSTVTGRAYLP